MDTLMCQRPSLMCQMDTLICVKRPSLFYAIWIPLNVRDRVSSMPYGYPYMPETESYMPRSQPLVSKPFMPQHPSAVHIIGQDRTHVAANPPAAKTKTKKTHSW
eukprot:3039159-Rhodomonas_salina.1